MYHSKGTKSVNKHIHRNRQLLLCRFMANRHELWSPLNFEHSILDRLYMETKLQLFEENDDEFGESNETENKQRELLKKLKEDNAKLHEIVSKLKQECIGFKELTKDNDEKKKKIQHLEKKIETLSNQLNTSKQNENRAHNDLKQTNEKYTNLELQFIELKDQNNKLQQINENLSNQLQQQCKQCKQCELNEENINELNQRHKENILIERKRFEELEDTYKELKDNFDKKEKEKEKEDSQQHLLAYHETCTLGQFDVKKVYRWGRKNGCKWKCEWILRAKQTKLTFYQDKLNGNIRLECNESKSNKILKLKHEPDLSICDIKKKTANHVQWLAIDKTIAVKDMSMEKSYIAAVFKDSETANAFIELFNMAAGNNESLKLSWTQSF